MADSPYAKSPIPCPIYPIINNEFNGNTYINSDTSKGGKVYINGEEAGAGGSIQSSIRQLQEPTRILTL